MANTKIVKLDDGTPVALSSAKKGSEVVVVASITIGVALPFYYCCKHSAKYDNEKSEKELSKIITEMAIEEFES